MAEATDSVKKQRAQGKPSTGDLLKGAREAKGLTIQQISQALHLDAWILEALEGDRFKEIGAPVFVKGHLRKFAAEVGLANDDVMAAYYRSEDAPETPGLVTDTLTRADGESRGKAPIIILSTVLIALIALVAWLWVRGNYPAASESSLTESNIETATTMPANTASDLPLVRGADTQATDSTGVDETNIPVVQQSNTGTNPPVISDPLSESNNVQESADQGPVEVPANDGDLQLSIQFANDSWVEIYDGRNRRLFFDLGKEGTTRSVVGAPPLQILLGNAEDARIRVNGETFVIPAGSRRGKTARFAVQ